MLVVAVLEAHKTKVRARGTRVPHVARRLEASKRCLEEVDRIWSPGDERCRRMSLRDNCSRPRVGAVNEGRQSKSVENFMREFVEPAIEKERSRPAERHPSS